MGQGQGWSVCSLPHRGPGNTPRPRLQDSLDCPGLGTPMASGECGADPCRGFSDLSPSCVQLCCSIAVGPLSSLGVPSSETIESTSERRS